MRYLASYPGSSHALPFSFWLLNVHVCLETKSGMESLGSVYYVLVEHFWWLYIMSFHSPVLQRVLVTPTSSLYPIWKICLQFSRKPDCRVLHYLYCPHLLPDCLIVWFNVTAAVSSSIVYINELFLQRFIKVLHNKINDQHSAREEARAQLPCWYNEKAANLEHREC